MITLVIIKDALEIVYYIAFIVLTGIIAHYAYKSYSFESSRNYELLCGLKTNEDNLSDYDFGFSIEIYNAGNAVAKDIRLIVENEYLTTIDFVKPNSSAYYPLGQMMQTLGGNIPAPNGENIRIEEKKPLKVELQIDGRSTSYSLCSDILFVTHSSVLGTLHGIENQLQNIEHALTRR